MSKRKYIEEGSEKPLKDKVGDLDFMCTGRSYSPTFFGPYLSERQWGTVREETLGNCWDQAAYDQIEARSYNWGEDGIFGLSDEEQKLCIGLTLWNGIDPVIKERFFGLTGPQGNHGEDVKELYFYLHNAPDHRYMRGLYLYPQSEFPYKELKKKNAVRSVQEYEILDTGVFNKGYWHIDVEFGKPENSTILCRYTVTNKGLEPCTLELSPKFWFRNCENDQVRRMERKDADFTIVIRYDLGDFIVKFLNSRGNTVPNLAFSIKSKDGYKCCSATYKLQIDPGKQDVIEWQMSPYTVHHDVSYCVEKTLLQLKLQADSFYESLYSNKWSEEEKLVAKGAWVGLLWNKQFYHYDIEEWYNKGQAKDTSSKDLSGNWNVHSRNKNWKQHFKAQDILAVPDKWEFPWFATWDTCFQMIPLCRLDPDFAKNQLLLLLSDRYMSPKGQMPGCEFNLDDNNPPIHAWACLKVFRMTGGIDFYFLLRAYGKLQKNYDWWISNLQCTDRWTFHGGFLGLDNISVIDRGCPPTGYLIKQADATAWMALFALSMLEIADILWRKHMLDDAPKDTVHYLTDFLHIAEQLNKDITDGGFWNPKINFYNDVLVEKSTQKYFPIEVKSLVGLLPLVSCCILKISCRGNAKLKTLLETESSYIMKCPDSESYLLTSVPCDRICNLTDVIFDEQEFLSEFGIRSLSKVHTDPYTLTLPVLTKFTVKKNVSEDQSSNTAINTSKESSNSSKKSGQIEVKQEDKTASEKGERWDDKSSTSETASATSLRGDNIIEKIVMRNFSVSYAPGESDSRMYGGNSNWRGPVWMCANYILLDALDQIGSCLEDKITMKRSEEQENLKIPLHFAIKDVCKRLVSIFLPNSTGKRPLHGKYEQFKEESWRDLILYYEYFHPDTGRGCGASHQTGWTSLIAEILYKLHS